MYSIATGDQIGNGLPKVTPVFLADVKADLAGLSRRQSSGEALFESAMRSIGTSLGRQIVRGLMGVLNKGR